MFACRNSLCSYYECCLAVCALKHFLFEKSYNQKFEKLQHAIVIGRGNAALIWSPPVVQDLYVLILLKPPPLQDPKSVYRIQHPQCYRDSNHICKHIPCVVLECSAIFRPSCSRFTKMVLCCKTQDLLHYYRLSNFSRMEDNFRASFDKVCR